MTTYTDFLARKAQFDGDAGFDPIWMPDQLFDFQTALVEWAIRRGRGALFADCGLGKTLMQLAWAENVRLHTGRPVIVAAPLAVTFQVEEEAAKFGIEAATSRDGAVVAGVTVTNYDRLHLFDSADFAGAVCDESSAIKAFDGKRRALVTEFMRQMRFRLLSTATAAPNDYRARHLERGPRSTRLHGHAEPVFRQRREGAARSPPPRPRLAIQGSRRRAVLALGRLLGARDAQAFRSRLLR
jgi:hypothetical protein